LILSRADMRFSKPGTRRSDAVKIQMPEIYRAT
jgi:hypothetical protein